MVTSVVPMSFQRIYTSGILPQILLRVQEIATFDKVQRNYGAFI